MNEVEDLHSQYLELAADSRFDEARPLLWRAIRLGRDRPELTRAVSLAKLTLARDQARLGEVRQAFDSLSQLRAIAEESGDEALLLQLHITEAQLLLDLGRIDEALLCGNAVLPRLQLPGSPFSPHDVADLRVAMAEAALEKGDATQARALLEAPADDQDGFASKVAVVARLDMARGTLADVEPRLRTRLREDPGTLDGRLRLLCALVEAQLWSNRPRPAVAALHDEWPAILGAGTISPAVVRLLTLAMRACADLRHQACLIDNRDLENLACQAAAEARRAADTLNLAEVVMHSALVTATVESWEGHAEAARFNRDSHQGAGWRNIAARWLELGRPHRAAYALLRDAQALWERHDYAEAQYATEQASDAAGTHVLLRRAIVEFAQATAQVGAGTNLSFLKPWSTVTSAVERVDAQAEDLTETARRAQLTSREREVMDLIAVGHTAVAAGRRLGISSRTVSKHLEHVYAKLGCDNRIAAIGRLRE